MNQARRSRALARRALKKSVRRKMLRERKLSRARAATMAADASRERILKSLLAPPKKGFFRRAWERVTGRANTKAELELAKALLSTTTTAKPLDDH